MSILILNQGSENKSDSEAVMMRWYKIFNTLWNLFENTLCYFDPVCEELGRGFLQIFMFYAPPSRDNNLTETLNSQSAEAGET